MAGVEKRGFEAPDETRTPPKTTVDVVSVGGTTVGRVSLQPGWRWSEAIRPIVGTDDCQVHHLGVVLSGRIHVAHRDGTEAEIGPGEVYDIQPGHDAWVVGDETMVGIEFDPASAKTFATE